MFNLQIVRLKAFRRLQLTTANHVIKFAFLSLHLTYNFLS